ncbi:MAG TPA: YbjN domain-containing protein [Acidimicrobiia bacterium]|nr:YbjN domain-containing protein [Acidimicrobiia bacterium]
MQRISDVIDEYLSVCEFPFVSSADDGVRWVPIAGQHGAWYLALSPRDELWQLIAHSVMTERVPVRRRREVALYLTRANLGLVLGNFEFDLDDGSVRYKTSIDVEGGELSVELVDHLVLANLTTFDRHLPGIRAVMGGDNAAEAFAAIEPTVPAAATA